MRARGQTWLWTLVAFAVRLALFLSSPEPTGWDGYSYVVQVERLVGEGRLHWPDASWVTYFLAALHLVVPSAIVAVKVGTCLLAALVVPAAARLGGWRLAAWAALSPTLTHLAGDFGKSLGLVAPLLVVLAWRRGRSLWWLVPAALVTATAHRLGAALLATAAVGALLGALARRSSERRLVVVGLTSLVTFAGLSWSLPNLLHPADLERLSGQLDFSVHLPSPWPYFALRDTSWLQRLELLAAWPALVVGGWRFVKSRERRARVGALLLPLALCVLPLWRTDVLDLGYRLALMAPVFAAPLLLGEEAPGRARWLTLVVAVLCVPCARTGFDPRQAPPYGQWRALIARIPRPLPALLIAPQGFNFLYDHETGHESLAWSPEPELDRTAIWRLAWGVRDGEWLELAAGLEPQPRRLSAEVVYVREDVWEAVLTRARALDDEELIERLTAPRNPSRVRPRSLRRNHVE
ncbi:MAG: hypothetical protein ACOZQL_31140 [Myxococcota bacterium]